MIARTWRCVASSENVSHYVEHFEHSVFPELRSLKGFSEAFILCRPLNDDVELTVMTLWESMDAIRSFAGENAEMAVVAPAAQAVLTSFDDTVTHYDVILNGQ
jgi:heme-degrading monooxygenase HmoA